VKSSSPFCCTLYTFPVQLFHRSELVLLYFTLSFCALERDERYCTRAPRAHYGIYERAFTLMHIRARMYEMKMQRWSINRTHFNLITKLGVLLKVEMTNG
jgi:hypothetical protein